MSKFFSLRTGWKILFDTIVSAVILVLQEFKKSLLPCSANLVSLFPFQSNCYQCYNCHHCNWSINMNYNKPLVTTNPDVCLWYYSTTRHLFISSSCSDSFHSQSSPQSDCINCCIGTPITICSSFYFSPFNLFHSPSDRQPSDQILHPANQISPILIQDASPRTADQELVLSALVAIAAARVMTWLFVTKFPDSSWKLNLFAVPTPTNLA